jgi:hypothetical protein
MTTLSLAEIVNTARKAELNDDKVQILKKNFSWQLRDVLVLMCCKNWSFDLPETAPPYTKSEIKESHGLLYREMRKMGYLISGHPDGKELEQMRKEKIFIEMLESIDGDDAELLVRMITKQPYPDLSPDVINIAFGDVIKDPIPVKRGRGRPKKNEQ